MRWSFLLYWSVFAVGCMSGGDAVFILILPNTHVIYSYSLNSCVLCEARTFWPFLPSWPSSALCNLRMDLIDYLLQVALKMFATPFNRVANLFFLLPHVSYTDKNEVKRVGLGMRLCSTKVVVTFHLCCMYSDWNFFLSNCFAVSKGYRQFSLCVALTKRP